MQYPTNRNAVEQGRARLLAGLELQFPFGNLCATLLKESCAYKYKLIPGRVNTSRPGISVCYR
jgi:hypothetical protein